MIVNNYKNNYKKKSKKFKRYFQNHVGCTNMWYESNYTNIFSLYNKVDVCLFSYFGDANEIFKIARWIWAQEVSLEACNCYVSVATNRSATRHTDRDI